ncbi:MAG: hypothetical protein BWX95_02087 [Bacteroidetes bacterium ADurb.Bin141]|nr:MAG: von Willebrand factor A [Bacteroidetes bacterium OLB10]MBV6455117.1 hypothetical protein [Bacteroidia bacterium]MBX3106486.1 DUF58 domain-containing protein [Bacteroidota bacterium]OQB60882.1 MAG: hypothetical protein BWX95_02087 [Bacteroidetes bacterium ADurb.Bin141]MCB0848451.1 DUF58 domain-containing protein [Bacteroidota bacterium]
MPVNYNEVQSLSHLELLARQVVEGFITGLHKSPFHGFSVEFAEHRLYNTGESTRHIDWKLFGRTDKLFVKRYEEETNLRCHLVVDNSSSMHYPETKNTKGLLNKINFSVHCAAALIYMMRQQRDAVGLTVFSDKIDLQTQVRSSSLHHKMLFAKLEELLEDGGTDKRKTSTAAAIDFLAESIHKRSLVVIFSDMFDNMNEQEKLFKSLQHLKHNKHEVILFHVTDKKHELDFKFESRPYRFVDVETGEEVKVHSHLVREKYMESIAVYKKMLTEKCAQYKIDFVEADINLGYQQILLPYLLKRQKLY